MKNWKVILISSIITFIGWASIVIYIQLPGFHWCHIVTLIGSTLISWPALWWWLDFLRNLKR